MSQHSRIGRLLAVVTMSLTAALLAGCPASEKGKSAPSQPATQPAMPEAKPPAPNVIEPVEEPPMEEPTAEPAGEPTTKPAEESVPTAEAAAEKAPDLKPLVENPADLKQLDPVFPVWIDKANNRVVMVGQVCQTEAPLEMFACLKNTKEHEAIVAVPTKAYIVHTGLLAVEASAGHPVQFRPEYAPATGTEIDVTVHWKDAQGKVQTARAQDWIRNAKTNKAMDAVWVFGGSGFWQDETTGQKHYRAEGGDLICVSNFSSAMLDLPIESSQSDADLMFQAFTDRIPPRGTPVTIVLTPKVEKKSEEPK